MPTRLVRHAAFALAAAFSPLAVGDAAAQGVPDYGLQWVTIGDPGNRGVRPDEVPDRPELADQNLGAVNYEFRMTRTELTTREWYEFVLAYAPYYDGVGSSISFTGWNITEFGGTYVLEGNADQPTVMSWEYAARYANWLHNDKSLTREAFESGAYDTSTFTFNPDGTANHQSTRSPGARFWIPSNDEWTKGAYWDPTKNDGEGGYWRHPGGSDVPLVSGPPQAGGQTNAGTVGNRPFNAGSYPLVNAPWGLLDTSGGLVEWTETASVFDNAGRRVRGSGEGSPFYIGRDAIDSVGFTSGVRSPTSGLRLASIVPSPSAFMLSVLVVPPILLRRQRCASPVSSPPPWGLCAVPQERSRSSR